DDPIDEPAAIERHRAGWSLAIDEPYWLRTWGAVVEGHIRGHLALHGGRLPPELHRAMLGMGVERPWRRRGHGRALRAAALAGAGVGGAGGGGLAWLDLGVFAHNRRARTLYASVGFVELGTTRDRYRVDDVVIDDVAMALKL